MCRLLLLAVSLFALASVATASGTQVPEDPPPSLLLLCLASKPGKQAFEAQFLSELRVTLDRIRVKVDHSASRGFLRLPPAEQVAWVGPRLANHIAALYLVFRNHRTVVLQIVTRSAGRALIRHIEAKRGSGAAMTLALAVREILQSEPAVAVPSPLSVPLPRAPPSEATQPSTAAESLTTKTAAPEPSFASRLGLSVHAVGLAGISGHTGEALDLGLRLTLACRIAAELRARVTLAFLRDPSAWRGLRRSHGWSLLPALSLLYPFEAGPLVLAPHVGMALLWRRTDMVVDKTRRARFSHATPRIQVGVELTVTVSSYVSLGAGIGFGYRTRQSVLQRRSDQAVVFATPTADVGFLFGVEVTPSPPVPKRVEP